MSVSTAMRQDAKHGGAKALRSYLTSLLYLRQEAKREGLDAVADIMWDGLAAIEQWLDTGKAPAHSREVLDSSLCYALEFLLTWVDLPPDSQRQVAHDIARYEEEISANDAQPRARVLTS